MASFSSLPMATLNSKTCTRSASCSSGGSSSASKRGLDQLLKLNNRGARLLQSKRYGKAVTVLTSCLTKTKELVASTSKLREKTNGDAYSFCFLAAFQTQDEFYSRSGDSTEATSISSRSSSTGAIFDGPLQILVDDTLSVKQRRTAAISSSRSLSMISAAVLYNLGLAFHLGTFKYERKEETSTAANEFSSNAKDMNKNRARPKKALELYKAAHSILSEGSDLNNTATNTNEQDTSMATAPRIQWEVMERRMALLNNIGHLHSFLGRRHERHGCKHDLHSEQARICQEEILSNLIAVNSVQNSIRRFSGYGYSSSGDTQRREKTSIFYFDLFFQNAIGCVLTPSPSAVAA